MTSLWRREGREGVLNSGEGRGTTRGEVGGEVGWAAGAKKERSGRCT